MIKQKETENEIYKTLIHLQQTTNDRITQNNSTLTSLCTFWAGANLTLLISNKAWITDWAFGVIFFICGAIAVRFGNHLALSKTLNLTEKIIINTFVFQNKIDRDIYQFMDITFRQGIEKYPFYHFLDIFLLFAFFAFLPVFIINRNAMYIIILPISFCILAYSYHLNIKKSKLYFFSDPFFYVSLSPKKQRNVL